MTAIAPTLINRVLDPAAESGVGSAQTSAGATLYPITYDTTVFHAGTRSVRTDRTTTTPNVTIGAVNMSAAAFANVVRVPVVEGETICIAGMVRCNVTGSRGRAVISWRDNVSTVVGTNALGDIMPLTLGAWNYVTMGSIVAVVPATAVTAVVQMQALMAQGQSTAGGEQAWFDSIALFSGSVAYPYFDGNTPGCRWAGTAHRSQSQQPPWQVWDGTKLVAATPEGQWNGSAVVPQTYVDISVV
jgi:hypothetical protein